jgi:AcrR family transcriptional regulator
VTIARTARAEQVQATRELIMTAAERLFAERGLPSVSARQISEAAGQGNTAAVGYHFGTKTGLIHAIIRRHTQDIEKIRSRMADTVLSGGSVLPGASVLPRDTVLSGGAGEASLRDWVSCLVRPSAEHLAALGAPTWFARFAVQVLADPELRPLLLKETFASPAIRQILKGLDESLSGLPAPVRAERDGMALALIVHVVAQHERVLADAAGTDSPATDEHVSWHDAATGLIDALVGLYQGPVTPVQER